MKIYIQTVRLVIAVPDGEDADTCCADVSNEILREHQWATGSCLIDYAVDECTETNLEVNGYVEGGAFIGG